MDIANWKKIHETSQKVGWRWITIKTFRDPAGNEQEMTTLSKPGHLCIATIALTTDKKVIIARQFRPGPERILDELPGGGVEANEDLSVAALRELSEETGYTTDTPPIYVGEACRDAYTNDVNHYYLATDCYQAREQHTDDGEYVKVRLLTIEQLITNAKTAQMSDSVGVLMAYDKLKELQADG